MPKLTFRDKKVTLDVEEGTTILDAALEAGIPLYHTCGGNCSCSTCRVFVVAGSENLSSPADAEAQVLEAFDLAHPYRLGCQAEVRGDVTVEIPGREREPRPNKTPRLP